MTSAPNREISNRALAAAISSIAQQASPMGMGQSEFLRIQFMAASIVVKMTFPSIFESYATGAIVLMAGSIRAAPAFSRPKICARRLSRAAFTLIELLVVISIIAVLAALLLPVYSSIFKKSNQTITLSNMRQLGVACLLYVGDHNYQLPNRAQAQPGEAAPDKWPTLFQPYVGDLRVYTSPIPDVNGKSYSVANQADLLSNSANNTSYICNGYNDLGALTDPTVFPRLNVIDHPSQTILFGIPYPKMYQFYMDFSEGGGNNNEVLNRAAFTGSTAVYVMSDGSAQVLQYNPSDDMRAAPKSANYYTDWLWLIDKSQTGIIQ